MKKSNRFLFVTSLLCALILGYSAIAMSAQQVKVPYVVSNGSWWTGIAITNESNDPIDDMTIYYTTKDGVQGKWSVPFRKTVDSNNKLVLIKKKWIPYSTSLPTIAGHAILVNTVDGLYKGSGTKTLPSDPGSIILKHNGNQKFSVTVYIGSGSGFAFQTFESTNP